MIRRLELDCDQTGWGLTPIIGVDAKFGKLNLAAKYEFKANMNIENNTHKCEVSRCCCGILWHLISMV